MSEWNELKNLIVTGVVVAGLYFLKKILDNVDWWVITLRLGKNKKNK